MQKGRQYLAAFVIAAYRPEPPQALAPAKDIQDAAAGAVGMRIERTSAASTTP